VLIVIASDYVLFAAMSESVQTVLLVALDVLWTFPPVWGLL
jgi:hypothetical protein